MRISIFILLVVSLISCKSYDFKVKDRTELAEVCHKEFPIAEIELPKPKLDTIYKDRLVEVIVKDSVDCTDKTGIVPIEYKELIKWRDTTIKETKYLLDPMASARVRLIADLQQQNDSLIQDIKKEQKVSKKALKQLNLWRIMSFILGGLLLISIIRR